MYRDLEDRYSLHPVFARGEHRVTENVGRGRDLEKVVNGQPYCRCGPMKFRGREGFYSVEQRLRDGRPTGEPDRTARADPESDGNAPMACVGNSRFGSPRIHATTPGGREQAMATMRMTGWHRKSGDRRSSRSLVSSSSLVSESAMVARYRPTTVGSHGSSAPISWDARPDGSRTRAAAMRIFEPTSENSGFTSLERRRAPPEPANLGQRRPERLQWGWPDGGRLDAPTRRAA